VRTKFDIYVFISRWQFHQSTCFLFKINLKEKFEDTKGVTRKRKPLVRQTIQWPRKRKEQTSIYITLHRKHKPLVRQTIQWPKETKEQTSIYITLHRKHKPLVRQTIQWPKETKEQTSIYITLHRKHKPRKYLFVLFSFGHCIVCLTSGLCFLCNVM
jgi:hypothetical protein